MMYRQWLGDAVGNLMKVDGVPSCGAWCSAPRPTRRQRWKRPPARRRRPSSPAAVQPGAPGVALRPLRPGDPLVRERAGAELPLPARPLRRLQDADQPALPAGRTGHRRAVRAVRLALRRLARRRALWAAFAALLICQFLIDLDTAVPARLAQLRPALARPHRRGGRAHRRAAGVRRLGRRLRLPEPVGRSTPLSPGHRQGRHGLRRLQAAGGARAPGWVATT